MTPPTCVLTTIKRFTYRGNPAEEWSNTFMLSGATPADSVAWKALLDDINLHERVLYSNGTAVVAAYGYDRVPVTGTHAIWSVDLTVAPNTPASANTANAITAIRRGCLIAAFASAPSMSTSGEASV